MSVESSNLKKPARKRRRQSAASKLAEAKSTTFKDVRQDKQIAQIKGILKNLKPEVKYKDYDHAALVDYNGTFFNVSQLISSGTADNANRVGDQMLIKSFRILGHLGATGAANSVFRFIVLLDKHGTIGDSAGGAAAAPAEILKTVGALGAVDSHFVFDAQGRKTEFIVLVDKRVTCGGNGTDRTNALFDAKYTFKYPPKSDYLGNGTSNLKNSLVGLLISDQSTAATNAYVVFNLRMLYTDP